MEGILKVKHPDGTWFYKMNIDRFFVYPLLRGEVVELGDDGVAGILPRVDLSFIDPQGEYDWVNLINILDTNGVRFTLLAEVNLAYLENDRGQTIERM